MSETAPIFGKESSITKVDKFGWVVKDHSGEFRNIKKTALKFHPDYQRDAVKAKVREMASSWSWIGCGAIVVGERKGEFWVIDGQHRVQAALSRADIKYLPCMVFQTEDVQQEALGFLSVNTNRKPISNHARYKALIAAMDENAIYVRTLLAGLGINITENPTKPLDMDCIGWALKRASENRDTLHLTLALAVDISQETPLMVVLLEGLHYMFTRMPDYMEDPRVLKRIRAIGGLRMIGGAKRFSLYKNKGGWRVWGMGMVEEYNKGLPEKSRIPLGE